MSFERDVVYATFNNILPYFQENNTLFYLQINVSKCERVALTELVVHSLTALIIQLGFTPEP